MRQVLADLDKGVGTNEQDRRAVKMVNALTRDPGMRQVAEKALAPQRQIIEREMQRERDQGKELGGKER